MNKQEMDLDSKATAGIQASADFSCETGTMINNRYRKKKLVRVDLELSTRLARQSEELLIKLTKNN